MKNVVFQAKEGLIRRALERARRGGTTLNMAFREWLASYARRDTAGADFDKLMRELEHVRFSRKFTRREMNTR